MKHQQPPMKRVLLVSNNLVLLDGLGDILRLNGFEVLSADKGVRAIDVFAANTINLIVFDYQTPFNGTGVDSGGRGTLEALTNIDPFLLLVLMREPEVKLDYTTSLTADVVLTHPVAPSALLDAIDTLLTEILRERVHRKSAEFAIYR